MPRLEWSRLQFLGSQKYEATIVMIAWRLNDLIELRDDTLLHLALTRSFLYLLFIPLFIQMRLLVL